MSNGFNKLANIGKTVQPKPAEQPQEKAPTGWLGGRMPGGMAPPTAPAPVPTPASSIEETFSTHPSQPGAFAEDETAQFKGLFEKLKGSIGNAPVAGQILRRIMIDLQRNPSFTEFILPEDVGVVTKTLRETYGLAVQTKKSNKRGRKKPEATFDGSVDDIDKMLKDMEF